MEDAAFEDADVRSTHCRLRAFAVDKWRRRRLRLSQETAFSRRFRGREHAIRLLDAVTGADLHAVDAAWRSNERVVADEANVTTR